jgi:hypothetical protein
MTATIAVQDSSTLSTDKSSIRPFQRVNFPEAELTELRRRVNNTRWPERETVTDATQGVQLATTQALPRYWATDYDWRRCEASLNALPQFITEIDANKDHSQAARYRFLYGSIRPFFVRLIVLRRPSKACFVGGPRWTDGYLY